MTFLGPLLLPFCYDIFKVHRKCRAVVNPLFTQSPCENESTKALLTPSMPFSVPPHLFSNLDWSWKKWSKCDDTCSGHQVQRPGNHETGLPAPRKEFFHQKTTRMLPLSATSVRNCSDNLCMVIWTRQVSKISLRHPYPPAPKPQPQEPVLTQRLQPQEPVLTQRLQPQELVLTHRLQPKEQILTETVAKRTGSDTQTAVIRTSSDTDSSHNNRFWQRQQPQELVLT